MYAWEIMTGHAGCFIKKEIPWTIPIPLKIIFPIFQIFLATPNRPTYMWVNPTETFQRIITVCILYGTLYVLCIPVGFRSL
jgi:hypothetical protein